MAANSSPSSSEPQLFHCPTCGASLPIADAPTVTCQYCGSKVLVPLEYRNQPSTQSSRVQKPIVLNLASTLPSDSRVVRRSIGVVVGVIVGLIVLGFVALGILTAGGIFATTALVSSSLDKNMPTSVSANVIEFTKTAVPSQTPIPPAEAILDFGGQGNGAGLFDDARYISLDPDGNIYVAEYQSGRVQKFDPTGKFIMLINVESDRNDYTVIRDMAVNYKGQLYIIRGGDILVYDPIEGVLIATIPGRFPDTIYDALAIDPANNLYALHNSASNKDLIKLDPSGNQLWRQVDFIAQIDKKISSSGERLAVDGIGYTYVVNQSGDQIYKFDPNGKYIDRFGGRGDGPGQLSSPSSIAIDTQGRVFINDSGSIDVFDADGNYLDEIPWLREFGAPRGMVFDLQGNLYFVTIQGKVVKLKINF
jgi:DNA-binding beta-propeller fold protein YncE/DNA-directed RNA polymerase subunit RPC12/RpoP